MENFGGFMETIPAKEERVKKIESQFQTTLPQDYRTFLLEYGYALPNYDDVEFTPIKSSGAFTGSILSCFFGIDIKSAKGETAAYEAVDSIHVIKKYKNAIAKWCIPIGDAHGNIICMSLARETFGRIYLWEIEEMPAQAKQKNLHLLANSFHEFLTGLKTTKKLQDATGASSNLETVGKSKEWREVVLLAFFGILMLILIVHELPRLVRLFDEGIETMGTVQYIGMGNTGRAVDRMMRSRIYVQYEADGIRTQRVRLTLTLRQAQRAFNIGDEIAVIYHPSNPNFIVVSDRLGRDIRRTVLNIFISAGFILIFSGWMPNPFYKFFDWLIFRGIDRQVKRSVARPRK
ncbi:MAG: SMI1/KNR4 family protein [Spirochaetes bacterium]|nr:SMI1/KNR4 family protein [Spirochaetota bacterium]